MEHGYDQAQATRQLLEDTGFTEIFTARDLAGLERCTGGRWQGARPGGTTAGH
ncbi:N5-glutamine S-adenosyl-L-methionine-dependent methyltransferase [compost metagenome]